jgi:hypothetical protein
MPMGATFARSRLMVNDGAILALRPHRCHRRLDHPGRPIPERAKHHPLGQRVAGEEFLDRLHGHLGGVLEGVSVDTRADRREGDGRQAAVAGDLERSAVTAGELLRLAVAAAAPHRANRLDDVTRLQPVAARDLRGLGLAPAEQAALVE